MGLIDWALTKIGRGKTGEAGIGAPSFLTTSWDSGREMVRPGNYSSQVAANKHWVYVCGQKNSAAVASTRLRLYAARAESEETLVKTAPVENKTLEHLAGNSGLKDWVKKGLEIEEVLEHPFLNLLKRVNPFTGLFSLLETTEFFLELTGNAYWYLVLNSLGQPVEIWIVPAQNVTIVSSKESFISDYVFRFGTEEAKFDPAEVVHFRFPNPAHTRYGRSPLAAVADTYNIFENMASFENSLFSNMARPEGVLTTDQNLGKTEIDLLRQMWAERYGGVNKAGKIAVLAAGLKYQNITMTPRELSYLAGRKLGREEICAAFGVPLSKVTSENVNLANARVGEEQYMRDTIRPRLWRIEEKINENLMPRYASNIFVAFDDPVPADREFELKRIEMGLKSGFLTINEVRGLEGLAPVSWGDKPWK